MIRCTFGEDHSGYNVENRLEGGWSTYGLERAQEEMGGGWSCMMIVSHL